MVAGAALLQRRAGGHKGYQDTHIVTTVSTPEFHHSCLYIRQSYHINRGWHLVLEHSKCKMLRKSAKETRVNPKPHLA